MHQALLAGSDFHKRAEVHQPGDAAFIDGADLWVLHNGLDNGQSPVAVVDIGAGNEHVAVFLHVHLNIALGADLLNDLSAGADDLADLIHRNGDGEHLGRVFAQLRSRRRDTLQNDLVQDIISGLVGLFQSLFHDFRGQSVDLQIHLDGGNALVGTGHLKVHIAEEIL